MEDDRCKVELRPIGALCAHDSLFGVVSWRNSCFPLNMTRNQQRRFRFGMNYELSLIFFSKGRVAIIGGFWARYPWVKHSFYFFGSEGF